ncbi:hypothetical protein D0962_26530 [Leptolyngbyaceae cyanobacterium CCMR0082]|uniref:Uncharacterized protein n=2 Tax=Adonisia turfae TaxID=2950184 RepID=A0A6M0SCS1_9CYAN|nr:hypothetical protein [Adonisia turfae]MDV3349585.1 hypothetical protein [Leptothoe sp. LEGE 181152]NEZ55574.1 hypothetical protein [Adonisia turfae CCMR0081]NEZ66277.1 hypothetical protein [Adonisia turfae CCMR0082]
MTDQTKNTQADEQISDEQLTDVSGGNSVHQRRLEHLDNQSKSVKDIQETRLEHLDNQSK